MDDESHRKPKLENLKKRFGNQLDNGKQKRHSAYASHGHSSGAPKVIETLYRILCPVKKIGSVLGKGGRIVSALRNETHANIRVADAIRGAEERVVIIFNYPLKQSEKVQNDQSTAEDDVVKNELDLRPHCPAQDALLKVHDRIAADEYQQGVIVHEKTDSDDTVTARILVPNNQVGCLLGKGGNVIKKLRSDYSGADIQILPSELLPPCAMSADELVQISGLATIVKKALYDISTRLHQHPRKENPLIDDLLYSSTQVLFQAGASKPPPAPEAPIWSHQQRDSYSTPPPPWLREHRNEPSGYMHSSYNSSRFGNDGDTPEEFSMRILCPTGKIGGVIGKSGANVRQLEHNTRSKILVEDTPPEADERIINVSSREGPWDQMSPTIEAALQLQIRTARAGEDGTITTRLLVPSSKVGCLLGQGGSIISEMRRRTRADIRVYSKEEKPSFTSANEELVQITGNQDVAREALLEIASRLRTRTFRAGNPTTHPAPVFPEHGHTPPERYPGTGLPSSHVIGAPGNPPPVYPIHGFPPPEDMSGRGPPPSSLSRPGNTYGYEYPKAQGPAYEAIRHPSGPGPAYEAQRHHSGPGPAYAARRFSSSPGPAATGYGNMNSTMEIKIPSNAVPSVLGVGGSNISEIRQISGAKVKLRDPVPGSSEAVVEIHGSSEQLKAAQSLLQAFVAAGGHNVSQPLGPPPTQAPMNRQY